ncbi:glycosyl transferase, partial [Pseudomonas fluorescens]
SLIRRDLLLEHDIFWRSDIRMGEDTLFLIEVMAAAEQIEYLDHSTFIYVKSANFAASSTQTYGDRELRNHLIVWRTATETLAKIGLDYVALRLQIGLQTALRAMIFVNQGDIAQETFADFANFLRANAETINRFNFSTRLRELIEVARSADA